MSVSNSLKNHSSFLGKLPADLRFAVNEKKILVVDGLQSSDIYVERDAEILIIAILNEGMIGVEENDGSKIPKKAVLNFHYEGENSKLTFLALNIGTGDQKYDFETLSRHKVPHTQGFYYTRSALFDKSQITYKGNLIIDKPAQLTDSYLAHHSLMLSKDAKTNTDPCLEIEANDVKAGHAATIGRVDESLMFYLQSRGLDKKSAQNLLIKGFLEADLGEVWDEEIRELLESEVESWVN